MQKNNSGSADSATAWPFVHAVRTVAHTLSPLLYQCLGRMVGTSEPTPYCWYRRAVVCLLCNVRGQRDCCCARNSRDSERAVQSGCCAEQKSSQHTALLTTSRRLRPTVHTAFTSQPLSLRTSEPRSNSPRRTAPRSLGSKYPQTSRRQTKQYGL